MCWAFQLIVLQKGWSSPRTAKWSRDKGSWHAFSWLCHNKPFTCDRNVHIPIHLTVITRLSRAHLSYVPLIPKACSSSARFCWTWNENNQNVVKTHSFWDPKSRKKMLRSCKSFQMDKLNQTRPKITSCSTAAHWINISSFTDRTFRVWLLPCRKSSGTQLLATKEDERNLLAALPLDCRPHLSWP